MSNSLKMRPIGSFCDVTGGKRLPKGRVLSECNTGHRYIRLNDFSANGFAYEGMKYLPSDLENALKRYRVEAGDLIISVAGTLGMVRQITNSLNGAYLTENANRLSNFREVLPEYLYQILNSHWADKLIVSSSTKSGQPKLALERIRTFQIPVPSTDEQQKIVEILSDCDDAIDVCKSGISNLRTQYKGMLIALIDKSPFEVTPIKLENLTYRPISYGVLKPSDYTECGVPMLRIQDIDEEGNLISAPYLITHEQHYEYRRTELNENDLICSLVGSIGRILNVPKEYQGGNVSRAFAVIGIKDDETRKFVEHSLRAPSFQSMVQRIATGNAQKVLNVADLKEFKLSFPQNREVLCGINLALEEALGQIKVAETQLNFLEQQKRGLMQQLLTGKLRVQGAA